jgi:hypothetical protein
MKRISVANPALLRELRLLDRGLGSKSCLHGERLAPVDVVEDELLALLGHGTPHMTRNRAVAPEDLCTTVVGTS